MNDATLLGLCAYCGLGMKKDRYSTYAWIAPALHAGVSMAHTLMGFLLHTGKVCERDQHMDVHHIYQASSSNCPIFKMAGMYLEFWDRAFPPDPLDADALHGGALAGLPAAMFRYSQILFEVEDDIGSEPYRPVKEGEGKAHRFPQWLYYRTGYEAYDWLKTAALPY